MSSDDFLSISLLRAIYLVCHLHPIHIIGAVRHTVQAPSSFWSADGISGAQWQASASWPDACGRRSPEEFLRRPRVPTNCVRHRCRQYSNCHTTIAR